MSTTWRTPRTSARTSRPTSGRYAADYGTTVAHLREAAAIAMRLGWVCRAVNGALPQDPGQTQTRLKMFLDGKP